MGRWRSAFVSTSHLQQTGNSKSSISVLFLLFTRRRILHLKRACFYFQMPCLYTTVSSPNTENSMNVRKGKHQFQFDKIDEALTLFNQMIHSHPRPSIVEFTQLLSSIVRMKHYVTAVFLIRQMELLGIQHNVYTLTILVNCFCRLHYVGFGFSVLAKMFKLSLQPNVITFSTLINGFCIESKVARAVKLLNDMVREGYQPNLISYSMIVKGLCKIGDTSGAIRLLRVMEERGCAPNILTYSTIIDSLCKDENITEALKLLSEM